MGKWLKEDASERTLAHREWRQTDAGKDYQERHKEYARLWRQRNPKKFLASKRRSQEAIKLECFQHYSGSNPLCKCCKEPNMAFLQLDHVDGDGADQRRKLKEETGRTILGGTALYFWLKKNNWPTDVRFQVLCANCNYSKRAGKYCFHEIVRKIDMNGAPIPAAYLPQPQTLMPKEKGPDRDAWLASSDGLAYIERQSVAKRGKPSSKDTRATVLCAECSTPLKRKQCLVKRSKNFFCNAKCNGAWKSKNLVGDKVYNYKPELHTV